MHIKPRIPRSVQRGFTLIELLIVIAILSFLTALVVPLGAEVLGLSRDAATKTTLKKIHELLQKRLDAFNRGYPKEFRRRFGREWRPANPGDIMDRKNRFKQLFLVDAAGSGNSAADSAEVLYTLLMKAEIYGTAAEDASEFGTVEIGDTDGDGKLEFLDAWGRPLRYYPYPTRLFKPSGHNPNDPNNYGGVDLSQGARILFRGMPNSLSELNTDQDDPLGVLLDQQTAGNYGMNEQNFHTFSTYHTPLVVSAGPDGELGLFEPFDKGNFGHLAQPTGNLAPLEDNLTNHNTKAGAD